VSAEVELRMLEGSEFQTVGAAMLKPLEANVVRTRGIDRRLVLPVCHYVCARVCVCVCVCDSLRRK